AEMEQQFPDVLDAVGLDGPVGMHMHALSGGMNQKRAVPPALLQDTDTRLLAERHSSPDEDSAGHVRDTLDSLWDNRTGVIVEHRVEYRWDKVDRVILMDDSAGIVRDGTPGDILTNHGDLLRALGVWHPRSWDRGPVFERAKPTEEILLEAKGLDVRRRKD